jgi:ABC-type transporter Mla subunit MlaD
MAKKHEVLEVNQETETEYVTRDLRDLGNRLKDSLKQEIASIEPLEGSYADRLQAFNTLLDQLAEKDKRTGARWMTLQETFTNAKRYGEDVFVAATVAGRVEFGRV